MAWEIESPFGVTIVDKPGGLDNASAYIGLVPDRKLGLVILANRGDVHPFEAARSTILPELARLLTPKQALGSAARQYGRTLPSTVVRSISRRSVEGKSVRAWDEQRLSHSSRSPTRQTCS